MTTNYIVPPCREALTELYRDQYIVVVNKPAGLLSVPGKPPNDRDSALGRLQAIEPETRVVHRLDMSTSGLMVFGLDAHSHRHLSRQFQDRKVSKGYVAEVWGMPATDTGEINLPLRCDWPNRPRQMVDHELGKPSLTLFSIIKDTVINDTAINDTAMEHPIDRHGCGYSRVWLTPVTGRSHQLRVHMAELGHPILGCEFYAHSEARTAAERLRLHASTLSFYHPAKNEEMSFNSPAPF